MNRLPENFATIIFRGLVNDIECPICIIDMTPTTIFVTPCDCRYILCYDCYLKMNKSCPQRCPPCIGLSPEEVAFLRKLHQEHLDKEQQSSPPSPST